MTQQHRLGSPFAVDDQPPIISGAGIVLDPRLMPMAYVNSQVEYYTSEALAVSNLSNGTSPPDMTAAALVAATDTTIVSLTGSGMLFNIVPAVAPSDGYGVLTVIVDGVAYIINYSTPAGKRFLFGPCTHGAGINATKSKIGGYVDGSGTQTAKLMPQASIVSDAAMPKLRFMRSLIVRIKQQSVAASPAIATSAHISYQLDT